MPLDLDLDPEELAVAIAATGKAISMQSAQDALESLWTCSMQGEADALRQCVESGAPITLDLGNAKNQERVRMRLYRCKRMLQDKGNRYVERLTFHASKPPLYCIRIQMAESILQYITSNPPVF